MKPKLPIKSESILQLVALVMIVFSLIGFFYVKIFYGSFGIEVSNYFVLSDYLAISVTKIYAIVLSIITVIIGIFIFDSLYKKDIEDSIDFEVKSFRIFSFLIYIVNIIIVLILTIQSYLKNQSSFYLYFFILLLLMAGEILFFVGKKYSIKRFYQLIIIIFLAFSFLFYGSIKTEVDELKRNTKSSIAIHLINNKNSNYILLGVNSNYIFLYDKNQSKSFIFPKDQLEYIEIKN